jgi:hypothetical protein
VIDRHSFNYCVLLGSAAGTYPYRVLKEPGVTRPKVCTSKTSRRHPLPCASVSSTTVGLLKVYVRHVLFLTMLL